jgi:hypothetical protein
MTSPDSELPAHGSSQCQHRATDIANIAIIIAEREIRKVPMRLLPFSAVCLENCIAFD